MNMMSKYKKVLLAAIVLLTVISTSAQNGTSGLPSQLSSSYSYVLSRTITQSDGKKNLDHVDYDNGLGQTYQKVDVAMAKNSADLVSLMEYDGYGRPLRSWLPGLGSGGACINASTLKQSARPMHGRSMKSRPWTACLRNTCQATTGTSTARNMSTPITGTPTVLLR